MTYAQAVAAYAAMVNTFDDGIVNARKIVIGRVGAVIPVWHSPRDVRMGFKRGQDGVKRATKVFHMDGRYKFKFRLFRRFIETRNLRWFEEAQL